MKKNFIQNILTIVFFVVFTYTIVSVANAGDVMLSGSVDIVMTIDSQQVTFQLQGESLNAFSVDSNNLAFSTTDQRVTLLGPNYVSFGQLTICDSASGKSKIEIPMNTSMTITPVIPSTTSGEYQNTCSGQLNGTSGSGGGGSSDSNSTTNSNNIIIGSNSVTRGSGPLVFNDLPGIGSKKLNNTVVTAIYSLSQTMINSNTYRYPANQTFYPFKKTTRYFAIQNALAVAGGSCGQIVTYTSCRRQAIKLGILDSNKFSLNNYIKRGEYFDMLIKAVGIPLITSEKDITANLCNDVKSTDPVAPVVATAKSFGIAPGESACYISKNFPRYYASVYAANALKLKK